MKVLLDTHILLWTMYDSQKLSDYSRSILKSEDNIFYYSLASVWEVEIKNSIGKLAVPSVEFANDCELMGFHMLPIEKQHIFALHKLEIANGHKDPFDRLLITQAGVENYKLLTEDSKIQNYNKDWIIPSPS